MHILNTYTKYTQHTHVMSAIQKHVLNLEIDQENSTNGNLYSFTKLSVSKV